jgi:hypothetical protein
MKGLTMTSSTMIATAAILCGVALLYLIVSRTLKKRKDP